MVFSGVALLMFAVSLVSPDRLCLHNIALNYENTFQAFGDGELPEQRGLLWKNCQIMEELSISSIGHHTN